jgi:hypothetical protein
VKDEKGAGHDRAGAPRPSREVDKEARQDAELEHIEEGRLKYEGIEAGRDEPQDSEGLEDALREIGEVMGRLDQDLHEPNGEHVEPEELERSQRGLIVKQPQGFPPSSPS